jgi:hypothetical protein
MSLPAEASAFAPERDIATIAGIVVTYFRTVTGTEARFLPATIEMMNPDSPEFSGRMDVEGTCTGWLSIGMPKEMLAGLLESLGENRRDEEALLDMTGEMLSTIVSNARAHFGKQLRVRPPHTASGAWAGGWEGRPTLLCLLPFLWCEHQGLLVVALHA